MRVIEFIAPVKAMRGNLSNGDQNLRYGGKRAYDVTGKPIVHADVYDDSYIGAKRAFNGKKYFALRDKSTIALGSANRLAMAAFGGAASTATAAGSTLSILDALQTIYMSARNTGATSKSFRGWLNEKIYPMIKTKQPSVAISGAGQTVTINNPWVEGGTGTDVNVPADVLAKFNSVLS